ncbi:putative RNA methyltransferase YfjO [Caldalkalibacillus thermarum]|uniref:23S rRNA (uracil(1939)-C(5))-methyltransferase RlmD n=1 Tax=Caldalkalibacillus thermarum TaxID=296745 RepID=UPI001668BD42|nr:23S rRNA (uracil(1939)-C(5))-methyltransferase RlmD [Caldalkalibacillus thermarum]GGK27988.1 putative RNA methyltransferase YfjO [Caldalkalibacillus thermarum]
MKVKPGQEVTLTIKRLGINGEGIGYYKKQVVFVEGSLPGEVIVAKIDKVFPNYATAKLKKIRQAAPERITPPCPLYDRCGGCQLQHLDYEAQLEAKKDRVIQAFERYTHLTADTLPIKPTIGMVNPWGYRNKGQLQISTAGNQVMAGLYEPGSHRLVDLSDCMIQHPLINDVVAKVRKIIQHLNIPVYNERKRTGVIRTIMVRVGFQTEQLQLVLITRTEEIPRLKELLLEIRYHIPQLTSIWQNIHPAKSSKIFGKKFKLLWGERHIIERLGDLSFKLSPRAFFQLNPLQTIKMYDQVKAYAALTGQENVVDAYCGVGTIGLWLAREAKEVRGMDTIKEAIEDAKLNAKLNGLANAHFEVGRAETCFPRWLKQGFKPDVIVVDPPRTGCDDQLLHAIVQSQAKRLVYVSCNPSTLAKDCRVLFNAGFKLQEIQPFDLFPHTSHVECCALLMR